MNWILLISAIVVAALVIKWLIEVVKTTVITALMIGAIVLAIYLIVGIGPQEIWQQILDLPDLLLERIQQTHQNPNTSELPNWVLDELQAMRSNLSSSVENLEPLELPDLLQQQ